MREEMHTECWYGNLEQDMGGQQKGGSYGCKTVRMEDGQNWLRIVFSGGPW
jgi:hypothetical protein